jgi:hypothetical protein
VTLKWEKTWPWNMTRRGSSGTCMLRYEFRDALHNTLCSYFYLDTPSNARKNDMSVTSRHEDAIAKRFVEHILSA